MSESQSKPFTDLCKNLRALDDCLPGIFSERYLERVHPFCQYYCARTLQAVGPDDDAVCPDVCTPSRTCFDRLIRAPRA